MKDYDVVVVGAGLGGLSTAANLVKAGKRVLVLERHNVPGGYASTFTRGRFEFEISLHELSGVGNEEDKGPLRRIFSACDVLDRVELIPIPEFYRSVFPDVDITVPIGKENFTRELAGAFPAEADNIERFMDTTFKFADEALEANRAGMKMVMEHPERFQTLMTFFGRSLSEVLNPMVSDERARGVLGQIWGYYCEPPSRMSFLIYALGNASYIRFGPWQIKGKSQALSQAFADAIQENGGDVWLSTGVSSIEVSKGSVTGVVTDDGIRIDSPVVVCNVNPVTTCVDLIGTDNVPSWYLNRLGTWTGGASTFNVYLGLDCPHAELGLDNHETFVNRDYDLDSHCELGRTTLDIYPPPGAAITAYNAVDEDYSPPGTCVVVITFISYAGPWLKLSPDEYLKTKERLADGCIMLAEQVSPGLRDHIEVIEVATPLTNARFTGNLGGSIIGFEQNFQGTARDSLPGRGPLGGLYFSNAWVNIGGGYEPTIAGGVFTSRAVLEDMERGGRDTAAAGKMEEKLEEQTAPGATLDTRPLREMQEAVARLHPDRVDLVVREVAGETPTTSTLRMEPQDGELPIFKAGQYVNLFVDINGVATSRPYSIASSPGEDHWDLTVRRVPDGFVSDFLLDDVKPGDRFQATAPAGIFHYQPLSDTDNLVFLAGGSGITPFASILREADREGFGFSAHLVYGSRTPDDVIFGEELRELASRNPGFEFDLVISEPPEGYKGHTGLLDAGVISSLVGDVEGKTFFVCGPAQMYELCQGELESMGVPRRLIKREAYGPRPDVTDEPGWPGVSPEKVCTVEELHTGKSFEARSGEPLLAALEKAGIEVPAVCRAGECTYCRTRLVSGKVFAPERVKLRWSDARAGYIHPCMSYPLEDLKIRIR